jgi:geranylgeranyl diphosphate synthase type I
MKQLLKNLATTYLPPVVAEMQAVLNVNQDTPTLFDGMIQYHMGWATADLQPDDVPAGKRIRPLLCLLACEAAGGDWHQAVPAAAAIEILHNFTLVHDDIQDHSPTRRGRKTLWTIWGMEQAINTGDAMFAQAHLAMARLLERGVAPEIVVQALRRLDETCLELTKGQHADMDFETRETVTVNEYLGMIDGKTAALLALAAELGALIAGKDANTVDHYAKFARYLGLAFQVRDDILGIWGDETAIGKSAATDIETKKKSLPVLYGLGKNEALRDLYAQNPTPSDFVPRAIAMLDQTESLTYTEGVEAKYTQKALDHMTELGGLSENLRGLTAFLLGRDS